MSMRKPTPTVEESPSPEPPRRKLEAKDAKIFQPSSFASRKARADADNAARAERRLVSLGVADFPQKNLKTGEMEAIEVEMFTDLDHPVDRWVQFPGPHGLVPLQDYVGGKDDVVRHMLNVPWVVLRQPPTSRHCPRRHRGWCDCGTRKDRLQLTKTPT